MKRFEKDAGKVVLDRLPEVRTGGVFQTSFCNHGHRLSNGVPINHECYVLNPDALEHERQGDVAGAIGIGMHVRRRHRGAKP